MPHSHERSGARPDRQLELAQPAGFPPALQVARKTVRHSSSLAQHGHGLHTLQGVDGPAPDGNWWTGYDECLAGWQSLVRDPAIDFAVEHVEVDCDRAVIRWRLNAEEPYRGVNLMRVRDGKIVEALGYGKRP
jgi:hypothetical protein